MESHARLGTELSALLRVMKDLHTHVVETSALPCEPAAAVVLGRLHLLGPVRLTELANALMLDPSSVSRQVSTLERLGLLAKEKDPADLRAQRLDLTDAGRAAVASMRAGFAETLTRLTPHWTTKDLDDLTDRLVRLHTDISANRDLLAVQETA